MHCKGLLMDIDNTLYDYESAHQAAMSALLDFLQTETALERGSLLDAFRQARGQIHQEAANTASSHNRALYLQRMGEILGLNPAAYVYEADLLYWDIFIENMRLFSGVLDFLEATRHLKLVFVTDLLAHIQFRKIRYLGLERYTSYVVTSEETGVEKPNPAIFQAALAKLHLTSDEVCMIGDHFEKDILGAQRLGIRAFWWNPEKDPLPPNAGDTVTSTIISCADYATLGGYFEF